MRVCPRCGFSEASSPRLVCLLCGAAMEEEREQWAGTVLEDRYRLDDLLGSGGMARVHRGLDLQSGRVVAIKVLRRELTYDATWIERMRREARAAAASRHPNIVEIFAFGQTPDGAPYIVMELLDGKPLHRILAECGRVPCAIATPIAAQIAEALACTHRLGIAHRDLKPENVFVRWDQHGAPHVTLVDFGLSRIPEDTRLTEPGQVVGTPQYMAPERAWHFEAGTAADLYSLGVVLFEMVTGQLPLPAGSPAAVVMRAMHEEAPHARTLRADIPAELDLLISRLLERNPEDRPPTASEVATRLWNIARREQLIEADKNQVIAQKTVDRQ